MEVRLILAGNSRCFIGNKGGMPWHITGDLQRFKRLTMYHPVIMGRKTYESLPNGNLPDREMYVCSKRHFGYNSGTECVERVVYMNDTEVYFSNLEPERLVEYISNTTKYKNADCIWVIGGAEIFKLYAPLADKIYLTHVFGYEDGDTKFDPSILDGFKPTFVSCLLEENMYAYRYLVYERDKQ